MGVVAFTHLSTSLHTLLCTQSFCNSITLAMMRIKLDETHFLTIISSNRPSAFVISLHYVHSPFSPNKNHYYMEIYLPMVRSVPVGHM